jgi:L-lactate dehydrogenase complex protein LldG
MTGGREVRDRILERIRSANRGRGPLAHPGDFESWPAIGNPEAGPDRMSGPVDVFVEHFTAAGGEVARVSDATAAATWLRSFCAHAGAIAIGRGVPTDLVPDRPCVDAADADVAISAGRAGIAETGSLLLDARDGRRTQLLAPTHVVVLEEVRILPTLRDALRSVADDLSAALGLHSGPSKSADIGQVMVEGVHGPGRLVALLVGEPTREPGEVAP